MGESPVIHAWPQWCRTGIVIDMDRWEVAIARHPHTAIRSPGKSNVEDDGSCSKVLLLKSALRGEKVGQRVDDQALTSTTLNAIDRLQGVRLRPENNIGTCRSETASSLKLALMGVGLILEAPMGCNQHEICGRSSRSNSIKQALAHPALAGIAGGGVEQVHLLVGIGKAIGSPGCGDEANGDADIAPGKGDGEKRWAFGRTTWHRAMAT